MNAHVAVNITSGTPSPAFVVVDARCAIKYVSATEDDDSRELKWLIVNRAKLQPDVEGLIRDLAGSDDRSPVRVGLLSENRILRVVRLVGSEGTMFILSVEEDRNRCSLLRAARRHQLTRRETEVLSLILDGSSAGEIADMLALSEHTVQGYFKRLLFKTGARNRVSMVASMFDWDSGRQQVRPISSARSRWDRPDGALEPLIEVSA
jgi:DNA-binding CsgD family transcriptional regulator